MVSIERHESKIFDLMKLDGERFVNESYALLLGRHPDSEGYMYYMWRLRCGISKRKIILQLLKAPEAVDKKEADPDFSREVDEWQKKTASIKYTLKSSLKILGKRKSFANSESNMADLIGQLNIIARNQARMNDEIAALRTALSNRLDRGAEHSLDYQMSRQAQYIYNKLLQPKQHSARDEGFLCE